MKPRITVASGEFVSSLAFSPNGMSLAAGCGSDDRAHAGPGEVHAWDVRTGAEVFFFRAHRLLSSCVRFSPDGALLASGGDVGTVILYDIVERRIQHQLSGYRDGEQHVYPDAVSELVFDSSGHSLAWVDPLGRIRIWDVVRNEERSIVPLPNDTFVCALLSDREGAFLALMKKVGDNPFDIRPVVFWLRDLSHEKDRWRREIDPQYSFVKATVPGQRLACWASSEPNSNPPIPTPEDVLILDLESGREVLSVRPKKNSDNRKSPWCLAISPNGRYLALGGGTAQVESKREALIVLWDLEARREVAAYPGHTREVSVLTFSPDGSLLASSGFDKLVKVWSVPEILAVKPAK